MTMRLPQPLSIGKLFGIPVLLDWSWMPLIPLYSWAVAGVNLPQTAPGRSPLVYWALGVTTTFLLLVSVVVHELAHALVARSEGLAIHDITLHFFGGMARMGDEPKTPSAELKIAVVGPGASFALGVLFLLANNVLLYGTPYVAEGRVLRHLGILNLVLATFNLLPGYPLDGGRALTAVLWRWRGNRDAALGTARSAGRAIAFSLTGVGAYVFLFFDRLTGLYSMSIGVLLLLVLGTSDRARHLLARRGAVEAVMRRPPVTIAPQTTIHDLVDRVLPEHRQTSFLVVADGRLHGILSLAAIRDLPRELWAHALVRAWMHPVEEAFFVESTTSVAEAEELLSRNGLGQLAVLDSEGLVVGSLEKKDLASKASRS